MWRDDVLDNAADTIIAAAGLAVEHGGLVRLRVRDRVRLRAGLAVENGRLPCVVRDADQLLASLIHLAHQVGLGAVTW